MKLRTLLIACLVPLFAACQTHTSRFSSATELTCKELILLRVILRQDMAMDARVQGDELARDRAAPLSLVWNGPNEENIDRLRAIAGDATCDEYKRLNAVRVLAYFGDRQSVDILSQTARGDFAASASGMERSKAGLCLLYLGCDLPRGFAFSRLANPLYRELDAFVKKTDLPVDPNAPYTKELIYRRVWGLGRSIGVRGPLSVADVRQEELAAYHPRDGTYDCTQG